jgi:nucleoside 2-deoxyribosyltransferase
VQPKYTALGSQIIAKMRLIFSPIQVTYCQEVLVAKQFSIYLAGPISGCNEKQKTEWRKRITKELKGRYSIQDPAKWDEKTDPVTKEIVEIDTCDIVIANLWRVSIGTVIGILHARRIGKPVILIDPNYIQSRVLEEYVGKESVVRNIDAALAKLESVKRQLEQVIQVRKKNGKIDEFSIAKLRKSINTACEEANAPAPFPTMLLKNTLAAIRGLADKGPITTDQIRHAIFQQLDDFGKGENNTYERERIKTYARRVKEHWEKQESRKSAIRQQDEISRLKEELDRLAKENENLEQRNKALMEENADLKGQVRQREPEQTPVSSTGAAPSQAGDPAQCYAARFPGLEFDEAVMKRLRGMDDRSPYENQFQRLERGKPPRRCIPDTCPKVYEVSAGYDRRVYFQLGDKLRIVLVGDKKDQRRDIDNLRERFRCSG